MLFKVIPTEEEMSAVNTIDCADDQLAKPEMLVRLMSKIPNVAARLECWLVPYHTIPHRDCHINRTTPVPCVPY
jgi:hypothetical protein